MLVDLINAVRYPAPAIESIEILNPEIAPEAIEGKLIVLDLLARDETGRRFNVEMQVRRLPAQSRRGVFHLARVMAGQLEAGENYTVLEPVIGIHLLDFDLFEDGRQNMCDGCPDAIFHKGKMVWSCRVDELEKFGGFISCSPRGCCGGKARRSRA